MDNNCLSERISNLNEKELKQCWGEIKSYNKNGMMGNTLVRQIRNEYAEDMEKQFKDTGKGFDSDCIILTISNILYEIIKRYYKGNNKEEILKCMKMNI